ncbi:class I SAM-dependent methyltransferase [Actinoplanes sp. NPDC049265]|uniref:class I SAM-dependent methyltransferase n=1 Tax=Actinoplanes sp. NPDC049265 TaxID=3363902 RepID=UPI0037165317
MNSVFTSVPLVPEISLHLAGPDRGLFDGGAFHSDRPPPFWEFAWAGGQGLARYVLDHPEVVRGRRVLDLATGSGLVAIAAARAGAAEVAASDSDPDAVVAAHRNARENEVALAAEMVQPDVVLVGDAFYTARVAEQMAATLHRARRAGSRVLVGDADRGFLPARLFERVTQYTVPVPRALEEVEVLVAVIWEMRNTMLSSTNNL